MTSATLSVNGTEYTLPEVDGVTLQFALRDDLGLTGTKFGCGMSQCGACMVLVDGRPTTSCVTPVASVLDKQITTIEGLAKKRHRAPGAAGMDRHRRAAVRLVPVRSVDFSGSPP